MSHFEDDYRPAAAELASEADKLWFKPHPSRRHRLRQALAGERPVTAEHDRPPRGGPGRMLV
jgi:hypothetical protein